jgi:hypothetical protein
MFFCRDHKLLLVIFDLALSLNARGAQYKKMNLLKSCLTGKSRSQRFVVLPGKTLNLECTQAQHLLLEKVLGKRLERCLTIDLTLIEPTQNQDNCQTKYLV